MMWHGLQLKLRVFVLILDTLDDNNLRSDSSWFTWNKSYLMHRRRKVSHFWTEQKNRWEVKLWPPVSHPSLRHVSLGIGGPVPLVQLGHVSHGGFILVIRVNNSVLTNLWISGCLFSSVPQHGVDQGHRDGHHGKYNQQSHNGQSPARVLQAFLRGLNEREPE